MQPVAVGSRRCVFVSVPTDSGALLRYGAVYAVVGCFPRDSPPRLRSARPGGCVPPVGSFYGYAILSCSRPGDPLVRVGCLSPGLCLKQLSAPPERHSSVT